MVTDATETAHWLSSPTKKRNGDAGIKLMALPAFNYFMQAFSTGTADRWMFVP